LKKPAPLPQMNLKLCNSEEFRIKKMKISEKTHILETLKMSGNIQKVYEKYGLDCPGCKGAGQETVEMAALNYGLDLNTFLSDLNNAVK
jgi:hypothetical protein